MGSTRPEREEPLARTRYVAAAHRFVGAFTALLARGVPFDPGRAGHVREWSAEDIAVLRELHAALGEVLSSRRSWDAVRRTRDIRR